MLDAESVSLQCAPFVQSDLPERCAWDKPPSCPESILCLGRYLRLLESPRDPLVCAVSVLSLPLQAMTFLLGAIPLPTSQTSPLGDHALLLLLLLINQAPQPAEHVGELPVPAACIAACTTMKLLPVSPTSDRLRLPAVGAAGPHRALKCAWCY